MGIVHPSEELGVPEDPTTRSRLFPGEKAMKFIVLVLVVPILLSDFLDVQPGQGITDIDPVTFLLFLIEVLSIARTRLSGFHDVDRYSFLHQHVFVHGQFCKDAAEATLKCLPRRIEQDMPC